MNHRELVMLTNNKKSAISWLRERGYIPQEMICEVCYWEMQIKSTNKGETFKCSKCKLTKSIFQGTIFYNTNKNICELLDLVYFWSINLHQGKTRQECNTRSRKTTNIWYNKLSRLSYSIMKSQGPSKIGGIGHIVEIDESLFSKRKYNVGRILKSRWVIGGIDLMTRDTFFVEVSYRNKEVLSEIIREHV
jgi:hypothetical protein